MIVKVLGAIDLIAAITFLLMVFGIEPWTRMMLFCAGLLFLKGLFVFTGDVLSAIDIFASGVFIFSIFFTPIGLLVWSLSFLLLAKGVVSFL